MESVFDWAKAQEPKKRKSPNKQMQQELFGRIATALESDPNSSFECVQALMKFDKVVLAPFYKDYYPKMSNEQKKGWDGALSRWANDIKTTENATIRMAIIIREKVQYVQNADSLLTELRWLSLHEDKRSIKEYRDLRSNSAATDLQKLLSLDASAWTSGKAQIRKMYGVIFEDIQDQMTRQLYADFLTRHGWNTELDRATQENAAPQTDNEPCRKNEEEQRPEAQAPSSEVIEPTVEQDGVALAQALLKWSQTQQETQCKQELLITEMRRKEQQRREQIAGLNEQLASLKSALAIESKRKTEIEGALEIAKAQVVKLEEKNVQADNTIRTVQQMAENSAKQELSGFRNNLANDLKKTVEDFNADVLDLSDAEKAEVYKALFDELIDTLRHHGIQIEVN